jgi:hypothetical protein
MDQAENILLQGYALTAVLLATEQAIATQGYAAIAAVTGGRIVVNRSGGTGLSLASGLTGGTVEE